MTGKVKMQLLVVWQKLLNATEREDEELDEDSALNILNDFRTAVREEMLTEFDFTFPEHKSEYE